jgi:activator of HSP90 ATPase
MPCSKRRSPSAKAPMWSSAPTCSPDRFQVVTSTGDPVSSDDGSRFEKSGVGYVSRMAVTESREVVIEATPDEIMDVLFDLESLAEWSSAHQKVEILERDDQGRPSKSRQVVKIVGVRDEQVLAYTVLDDGVSWTLVSAKQQRAQDARYTLTSDGDSTRVRFELTIDPLVPLPGFLIRKGIKGLMDTATEGLRKRVLEVKKGHP